MSSTLHAHNGNGIHAKALGRYSMFNLWHLMDDNSVSIANACNQIIGWRAACGFKMLHACCKRSI
ncbi:MAG: hypothetical protein ACK53U_03045 [Alphaproteobacteria bacterium]|jgi:hypothetical protein